MKFFIVSVLCCCFCLATSAQQSLRAQDTLIVPADTTMIFLGDEITTREWLTEAGGFVDIRRTLSGMFFPVDSAIGQPGFPAVFPSTTKIQIQHKFPLIFVFTDGEAMWAKDLKIDLITRRIRLNSAL